jgi:isoleucyl-tRNA synthetase
LRFPGWAIADDVTLSVAVDTEIDPELELRGRVYELIHTVNTMRKDAGLELTDRIVLTSPTATTCYATRTGSRLRRWRPALSLARRWR